jgi:hypothetical protein
MQKLIIMLTKAYLLPQENELVRILDALAAFFYKYYDCTLWGVNYEEV